MSTDPQKNPADTPSDPRMTPNPREREAGHVPIIECRRACGQAAGPEQVVLLSPQGERTRVCGPYCAACTAALTRILIPIYTGSSQPAFVVEPRT